MPVTPPFAYKQDPNPEAAAPAQAVIVTPPVFDIVYDGGCYNIATVHVTAPVMNREPSTIPNQPGTMNTGYLEYFDMGVAPESAIPAKWSGDGAGFWAIYLDGVLLPSDTYFVGARDGDPTPWTSILPSMDWTIGHTIQLRATYHDRPAYRDFYMGDGIGVIADAPSAGPCPSIGSIGWGDLDYWDPWVRAHHDEPITGPVDRWGNTIASLTGPWGSAVTQQALATDPTIDLCSTIGVSDGSAFACSLTDVVCEVTYPEVAYEISTEIQVLYPCSTPRDSPPVFQSRFKAEELPS